MILQFFKKKPKKALKKTRVKKVAAPLKKAPLPSQTTPSPKPLKTNKVITAEGWRRLMMKK